MKTTKELQLDAAAARSRLVEASTIHAEEKPKPKGKSRRLTGKSRSSSSNNESKMDWKFDVYLKTVFEEYDDDLAHADKYINGKSKKKKAKKGGERVEGQPPTLLDANGWYSRNICNPLSPYYFCRRQKGGMDSIQQLNRNKDK